MTDHTPGEFTGKVVYITGAGDGIGRATAFMVGHTLVMHGGQTIQ